MNRAAEQLNAFSRAGGDVLFGTDVGLPQVHKPSMLLNNSSVMAGRVLDEARNYPPSVARSLLAPLIASFFEAKSRERF